jgi:hypothetical protein
MQSFYLPPVENNKARVPTAIRKPRHLKIGNWFLFSAFTDRTKNTRVHNIAVTRDAIILKPRNSTQLEIC